MCIRDRLVTILSVKVLYLFRIEFQSFLHVFCRTFLVAVQQLGTAALMIGLCEIRVQFCGFRKELDGFCQFVWGDVKLS